ncbi:anaerobic sulfatase maturase [Anaerohalosphaeraceae bacterium U12dextr]
MAKPAGPACNLGCTYCYYLHKKQLFPDDESWRMSNTTLERFIRQYIQCQPGPVINFSWQGGEPTLLDIGFFQKAFHFQKLYCPPTKQIINDFQTNGMLLNDQWCRFFRENYVLVGLSIDGPADLHNYYRKDRKGQPTFDKVVRAVHLLKKHGVEFNILTVLNNQNAKHPLRVYRYFRDELNVQYLQFIPCVEPRVYTTIAPQEWDKACMPNFGEMRARPGFPDSVVTEWSVDPDDYGNFLITVFDEWVRRDVGKVFIGTFDTLLGLWMGLPSSSCYFSDICGKALAIEHDGGVYSCDHYVYPAYYLGNIREKTLDQMVMSEKQIQFGLNKEDTLPQYCKQCSVQFACHGECPKHRFVYAPDGEFGLNYLCSGLRKFLQHIDPWMRCMVGEIRAGRTADVVMKYANPA